MRRTHVRVIENGLPESEWLRKVERNHAPASPIGEHHAATFQWNRYSGKRFWRASQQIDFGVERFRDNQMFSSRVSTPALARMFTHWVPRTPLPPLSMDLMSWGGR